MQPEPSFNIFQEPDIKEEDLYNDSMPTEHLQPQESEAPANNVGFDVLFNRLLGFYSGLQQEERAAAIARAMQPLTKDIQHSTSLHQMLDLLWSEGIANGTINQQRPSLCGGVHASGCQCEDCPYKKELLRVENFYEDVFSLKTS